MKIFIDKDFYCHATNSENQYRKVETCFFDGKCPAFIEGYQYIPDGESWTRSDGVVFRGEMIAPYKPYEELDAAQREYERSQIAEYEAALSEIETALGVTE